MTIYFTREFKTNDFNLSSFAGFIKRFIEVSLPTFFKFSKQLKPVPAGINRPIITFSFKPFNQSFFPSIAAC